MQTVIRAVRPEEDPAAVFDNRRPPADDRRRLARVELECLADDERAGRRHGSPGLVAKGRQVKAYFRDGALVDAVATARVR